MILLIPSELQERVEIASDAAIFSWGTEEQFRQAQEECCELGAAINHMLRKRPEGWASAVEETADVILCAMQLRIMLGPEVDAMVAQKLARLEGRIAAAAAVAVARALK